MNTLEITTAFELLKKAKLTKLEEKDKFIVIKVCRALKPIYTDYQDFIKDAQEKLKGDEFDTNLTEYQNIQKNHPTLNLSELSAEEAAKLKSLTDFFNEYNKSLNKCLSSEATKNHNLDYEKLSENAFSMFINSNDYTVEEILKLQDVLM